MTEQTLLIVDDDKKIRTLLRNVMEDEGFKVIESDSRNHVLRTVQSEKIDLVTLDINLGADNGLEIAREIRTHSRVPIIMVSGKDDVIDRVVGLEVGADDYITKPFHVREVVARVRTVLRRVAETAPEKPDTNDAQETGGAISGTSTKYMFDGMVAYPDRLELVDRDGSESNLTSGDFRLLSVFLERPNRVLSRDQLMDLTGGLSWSPLDRTIDNQIARLRKKIEREPTSPRIIKTVRGIGYTLACSVQVVQSPDASCNSA